MYKRYRETRDWQMAISSTKMKALWRLMFGENLNSEKINRMRIFQGRVFK